MDGEIKGEMEACREGGEERREGGMSKEGRRDICNGGVCYYVCTP